MKGSIVRAIIAALIAVSGAIVGCRSATVTAVPQETAIPSPTRVAVRGGNTVVADGKVIPLRSAALSLPRGGIVSEVLVAEGQMVEAGQVLVRLQGAWLKADVWHASAVLDEEEAKLKQLKGGPTALELAEAEAQVAEAQAALDRLKAGPDEAQLAAARAELDNAQATRDEAQAAYDRIKWQPGGSASPEAAQLRQATNNYTVAKARLDLLVKGARPAEIAAAQAAVRRAQAQLNVLKAGPRPEAIAAAEAHVSATKATLEETILTMAEAELQAPFTGTLVSLAANVGEYVATGTPLAVLADLQTWQVQTTDLTEMSVVRIREGDAAVVTCDALPGVQLQGKVVRIGRRGEESAGNVVYTAIIQLDQPDSRLRWNMTAAVTIKVQ